MKTYFAKIDFKSDGSDSYGDVIGSEMITVDAKDYDHARKIIMEHEQSILSFFSFGERDMIDHVSLSESPNTFFSSFDEIVSSFDEKNE